MKKLTDREYKVVALALQSALVCLAGNPDFEIEERQIREALDVLGLQVVTTDGRPV